MGLHAARDALVRHVLATPPEQVAAASATERARVDGLAHRILPVSARAAGLRDDTRLGKGLRSYALESIRVPTLVVSARDDGFGTYAAAEYTASRIPGAKFVGFDSGSRLLVGQDAAVQAEIACLVEVGGRVRGRGGGGRPQNRGPSPLNMTRPALRAGD